MRPAARPSEPRRLVVWNWRELSGRCSAETPGGAISRPISGEISRDKSPQENREESPQESRDENPQESRDENPQGDPDRVGDRVPPRRPPHGKTALRAKFLCAKVPKPGYY